MALGSYFKKKTSHAPDLQHLGQQAAVSAAFPADAAQRHPSPGSRRHETFTLETGVMLLTENDILESNTSSRLISGEGQPGLASVTDTHQSQCQPAPTFILTSNLRSFKIKKEQAVNCK